MPFPGGARSDGKSCIRRPHGPRPLSRRTRTAGVQPRLCRPGRPPARADKRGDGYGINGKKHWITGGGVSKLHLIFARVFDEKGQERGIGGFLAVRDEAKGLSVTRREKNMGLRGV